MKTKIYTLSQSSEEGLENRLDLMSPNFMPIVHQTKGHPLADRIANLERRIEALEQEFMEIKMDKLDEKISGDEEDQVSLDHSVASLSKGGPGHLMTKDELKNYQPSKSLSGPHLPN